MSRPRRVGRLGLALGLAGAAIAGSVATVAFVGDSRAAPAASSLPRVATARVVRTNLVDSLLTAGSLGYVPTRPLVDQLAGTYTGLPPVGRTIGRGQRLYSVDETPVVLMLGTTPAWRPFGPGMTSGADVSELQQNLIALGDGGGLFSSATGVFDWSTQAAVERWQSHLGLTPNGRIPFGEIEFLPSSIRVESEQAAPGEQATPGAVPFAVTTNVRQVLVPMTQQVPPVHLGETVGIQLPSNASTPGRITYDGPPPAADVAAAAASAGGSSPPGEILIVTPLDPSATGTGEGSASRCRSQRRSRAMSSPCRSRLSSPTKGEATESRSSAAATRGTLSK